jgi:hypothetical protein
MRTHRYAATLGTCADWDVSKHRCICVHTISDGGTCRNSNDSQAPSVRESGEVVPGEGAG